MGDPILRIMELEVKKSISESEMGVQYLRFLQRVISKLRGLGMIPKSAPKRTFPLLSALVTTVTGSEVNRELKNRILSNQAFMAGRFGSSELEVVIAFRYANSRSRLDLLKNYLFYGDEFWWTPSRARALCNNAGFFPYSPQNLDRYSEMMISAMGMVDILGAWVPGENLFQSELASSLICNLGDLEPYYHAEPWSEALQGKRVLVVSPFADTIRDQYAQHREALFDNPKVLPEFDLIAYRAVQSIAGAVVAFKDWFEALDYMTRDIAKMEFDIAIIGCGAYGFPLAARVKAMGRQAIHLGGATQILFGVKGRRWEEMPEVAKFFNGFWTRPRASERPANADRVEAGCYW